jgi:hypothetical protein
VDAFSEAVTDSRQRPPKHAAAAGHRSVGYERLQELQIRGALHGPVQLSVFNVLNHSMFAANTEGISRSCNPPDSNNCSGFGTYFATPDVGLGFNPILGTGAQRNMQFGLKFSF